MDPYILAYEVVVRVLMTLLVINLFRITWLALRHGRVTFPPMEQLGLWVAERLGEGTEAKRRYRRLDVWARPYGYMALVTALVLLYVLADIVIDLFRRIFMLLR